MDELGIELVERWRKGDQEAVDKLYQRYVERMMRIVCGHLSGSAVGARLDAEDVVQSAMFSVFRRMQNGEFEFRDDADLWKLLVTVVLNKTRTQVGRNLAAMRSVNREQSIHDCTIDESIVQRVQKQPCISDVLAFRETLELIFAKLDDEDGKIIQMRLEGYSQTEIAEKLDLTTRTIRRKLTVMREALAGILNITLPASTEPDD